MVCEILVIFQSHIPLPLPIESFPREWISLLLSRLSDRPIFLVELPYVAMRMVDTVPTATETTKEVRQMLHQYGYDKAVYVSHSLGTAVTSWIIKLAPDTVAGTVMIDPICFLLHYHHVAFNFVHRLPRQLIEVSDDHSSVVIV